MNVDNEKYDNTSAAQELLDRITREGSNIEYTLTPSDSPNNIQCKICGVIQLVPARKRFWNDKVIICLEEFDIIHNDPLHIKQE